MNPYFIPVKPFQVHKLPEFGRKLLQLWVPDFQANEFDTQAGNTRGGHTWDEWKYFKEGNELQGLRIEIRENWFETFLANEIKYTEVQLTSFGLAAKNYFCLSYDPVFGKSISSHTVRFCVVADPEKEMLARELFSEFMKENGASTLKVRQIEKWQDFDFILYYFGSMLRKKLVLNNPDEMKEFLDFLEELENKSHDAHKPKKFLDYYHELFIKLARSLILSETGKFPEACKEIQTAHDVYSRPEQPWNLTYMIQAFVENKSRM